MTGFSQESPTWLLKIHSILVMALLQLAFLSNLTLQINAANGRFLLDEKTTERKIQDQATQENADKNNVNQTILGDTENKFEEQVESNYETQIQLEGRAERATNQKDFEEAEKSTTVDVGEEHVQQISDPTTQDVEEQKHGKEEKVQELGNEEAVKTEETNDLVNLPEPYLLGPTIKDWDEQRQGWLEDNAPMKSKAGKPRVLIVTGSQPKPCRSPVGDNFHLKSLKNKLDYTRIHDYEIYYNFVLLDSLFNGYWVKLPTVRKLMLTHPEIEWFLWVDSDAVFTDMLFEIPFVEYEGYNMVMWGLEEWFKRDKSWLAFNAGVFFLRNCQWSLDLIDKWSPMGPDGPVRDQVGKMLTNFLSQRGENYPADDQSALAYLMLTDETVMSKIKLVDNDYAISAWWVGVVDHYEECMKKYHPGLGDHRWPFITHFTGCSPCNGHGNPEFSYDMCMDNFNRAFNFADNQVLAFMGFQHGSLSSADVMRTRNETIQPLEVLGLNPWGEQASH